MVVSDTSRCGPSDAAGSILMAFSYDKCIRLLEVVVIYLGEQVPACSSYKVLIFAALRGLVVARPSASSSQPAHEKYKGF